MPGPETTSGQVKPKQKSPSLWEAGFFALVSYRFDLQKITASECVRSNNIHHHDNDRDAKREVAVGDSW